MDTQKSLATIPTVHTMHNLGQAANAAAAQNTLRDYQDRQSAQTLRRQDADVRLFQRYLADASGLTFLDMASNLETWSGVTYGLVEGFNRWQLQQGYAIGSINVRLATIKTYCELAAKSGSLNQVELVMIKSVKGYRHLEARNQDEKRAQTRRPEAKKAEPVSLSPVHASLLKQQPDTKKGRRDALIVCLLVDHGLRCGEVSDLDVSSIDLQAGTLTFYRHKVDKIQTHRLTPDTWKAAKAYLDQAHLDQDAPLFAGTCSGERICERSINARVSTLGKALDLDSLSPHDCRHYWATDAMRKGTDIKSLQTAGGWTSPAMPLRYAEASEIANEGVKLSALTA